LRLRRPSKEHSGESKENGTSCRCGHAELAVLK
jgi:hypothetical protein